MLAGANATSESLADHYGGGPCCCGLWCDLESVMKRLLIIALLNTDGFEAIPRLVNCR